MPFGSLLNILASVGVENDFQVANKSLASLDVQNDYQPATNKKSLYKRRRALGKGGFGTVYEADGPMGKVAMKSIQKKDIKGNEQMVFDEMKLLQRLRHSHITAFRDWFETKDKYYIVTQLATGGDLLNYIEEREKLTEKEASQVVREVLGALSYLHGKNIVHLDVKLENLLRLTCDPDSSVVLADFGAARILDSSDEMLKTVNYTPGYKAPEVIQKKGQGKAIDMWCLGVVTYTLLCGETPFEADNDADIDEKCISGWFTFGEHERHWGVSRDAKFFIMELLQLNPEDRPTSQEALKHSWLTGETTDYSRFPEIMYTATARLRRGIEIVKLSNRINALKMQAEDPEEDLPSDAKEAVTESAVLVDQHPSAKKANRHSKAAVIAIFQEVVLAKVRDSKAKEEGKRRALRALQERNTT